jgi:hypothetical protein
MNMSNDAHDLFFRTEQRHDDMVWAAAVRCPTTATSGESPEEIADQALKRAWLAIVSRGSVSLPMWQRCSPTCAYVRPTQHLMPTALAVQAKTAQRLAVREIMNPERTVLEQLDRTQLWSIVKNLITTEQEWVIFVERYMLNLPPRRILARHPSLFTAVRSRCTRPYARTRRICSTCFSVKARWPEESRGMGGRYPHSSYSRTVFRCTPKSFVTSDVFT